MFKKLNEQINPLIPEAVLFDTDNTLYNYEPANRKATNAIAKKIKNILDINKNEFLKNYMEARNEIKNELGPVAGSHSRLLYCQRLLEKLGFKAQLMIALDLEETFWRTFLANAPLFPGVRLLLKNLQLNNVPIAIVTDLTAHTQLRKLTYFNLEETFDAVVTSEEAGADKPDKRNFDLVLKKLALSPSNRIWMIGDNPSTDIAGGKLISAITFQKIHTGVSQGRGENKPDFIFDSFVDLNKYFLKIKK